ncbi:hypothetical protein N7495_005649 [Penicillium taxi]|uniref:uncharacterized protein n=1 Tax=Penicillium taxi TaxID=168475 RepID=UPI0025457261|nr:uncharacterized protein N7495_005649 [Penicillium taxi]KAJ5893958.1 hypothetical protein N7495_005649 [Penicillium taxi]
MTQPTQTRQDTSEDRSSRINKFRGGIQSAHVFFHAQITENSCSKVKTHLQGARGGEEYDDHNHTYLDDFILSISFMSQAEETRLDISAQWVGPIRTS